MNLLLKCHWFFPVTHASRPRLNTKLCLRLTKSISKHEKPFKGVKLAQLSFISIDIRYIYSTFPSQFVCLLFYQFRYGLLFFGRAFILPLRYCGVGLWNSTIFCVGKSSQIEFMWCKFEVIAQKHETLSQEHSFVTLPTFEHKHTSRDFETNKKTLLQCFSQSFGQRRSVEFYLNCTLDCSTTKS